MGAGALNPGDRDPQNVNFWSIFISFLELRCGRDQQDDKDAKDGIVEGEERKQIHSGPEKRRRVVSLQPLQEE